ncbi:hypothetical protein [Kitasatospora phosalacinea]|uniref:hypothetical protein n=1 Tax=Kitasatospora phosalacinea TaxID=2065 RepID=UPI000AC3185D|nr:hypothetical protein [Kitasatospora phosalacinea]
MTWEVPLHEAVDAWFVRPSADEPEVADQAAAAIDKLAVLLVAGDESGQWNRWTT